MKKVLVLALCACSTFGQILRMDFSRPDLLDFTLGDGSFALDTYRTPRGVFEIGGLGMATSSGGMKTRDGLPIDATLGYGDFGDFRETTTVTETYPNPNHDPARPIGPFNPGPETLTRTFTINTGDLVIPPKLSVVGAPGIGSASWVFTLYDSSGGTYSHAIQPITDPGVFQSYNVRLSGNDPDFDWTSIVAIGVAGDGSEDAFHAGFRSIALVPIPEPSTYAAIFGAGLLFFATLRRKFNRSPTNSLKQ